MYDSILSALYTAAMMDPHEIDWFDVSRLLDGTPCQRSAAEALLNARLMEKLGAYSPVLCGTVPIDCDLPESDLDMVCYAPDLDRMHEYLSAELGEMPGFAIKQKNLFGVDSVICRLQLGVWPVEIVAQPLPVQHQRAYGHMLAEALLLYRGGPEINDIIRGLKRRGLSTEEAFASHFGLPGDPYEALLHLYKEQFGVAFD